LDSRVLRDQKLNKRVKQCFASLSDVVHKLKATQVRLMLDSRVMDLRML
jgi:hypothetical protein